MLPVLWLLLSAVYLLACAGLAACGSLCWPLAKTESFAACRNLFGAVLMALSIVFGLAVTWALVSSGLTDGWREILAFLGSSDTLWLGASAALPSCLCWPVLRWSPTVVLVVAFCTYGRAFLLIAAGA